jgi:hypothetical protein
MKRIKGAPRRATDERLRLHAIAARIPTQEALDGFVAAAPAAIRAQVREMIAPHTRFNARSER